MIERIRQVGWVLDHLDDIASDMSVFHRVDDVTALDGPTFLRLAWRLAAYRGVMRERALAAHHDDQPNPTPLAAGHYAQAQDINPGTQATLQADANFQGLFSFG